MGGIRVTPRWMAAQIRQMQDVDPTVREWLVKLSELLLYFLALVCVLVDSCSYRDPQLPHFISNPVPASKQGSGDGSRLQPLT